MNRPGTLLTYVLLLCTGAVTADADSSALPLVANPQGFLCQAQESASHRSPGGRFEMQTRPAMVGPVLRADLTVRDQGGAQFLLSDLRGDAFLIADAGYVIAIESSETPALPAFVRIYDLQGRVRMTRREFALRNPCLSPDGALLVYAAHDAVVQIDLIDLVESRLPVMDRVAAGPRRRLAGVRGETLFLYTDGSDPLTRDLPRSLLDQITGCAASVEGSGGLPPVGGGAVVRQIAFTAQGDELLLLGRAGLGLVDPRTGEHRVLLSAPGGARLRDLEVRGDAIYVGLRYERDGHYSGELWVLDHSGGVIERRPGAARPIPQVEGLPRTSRGIPWPLAPDQQHPVGNTYGEYQNYGGAYLHPGVDAMGDPGQPVYAVHSGQVKAVMTTAGEWHWRVAVADSATAEPIAGYLYAHLDEYSIAVDVGDPIVQGQYLGDLVEWPVYGFTHIHFARIEDEGEQWHGYWLCTENPHLDFDHQDESEIPFFEPAISDHLLAFCYNQTAEYIDPTALNGEVDIVAHVADKIGTDWDCSVQEIRYTIYRVGFPDFPVVDDKQSVFFDMVLDTYIGGPIDPFLVELFYKEDWVCNSQGDYEGREFFHIISNSDGNQVYEQSDLWEAWDTTLEPDGDYIVRVTIRDVIGNTAVDSMVVTTANGNPSGVGEAQPRTTLHLRAESPALAEARLNFRLPAAATAELTVHDVSGRAVRRLAAGRLAAGEHTLAWDGRDTGGRRVCAGVYLCRLRSEAGRGTARVLLLNP